MTRAKGRQGATVPETIDWPRADPQELAAFDPRSKVCTMNCSQHALDPRSRAECMLLCTDCDKAPPVRVRLDVADFAPELQAVKVARAAWLAIDPTCPELDIDQRLERADACQLARLAYGDACMNLAAVIVPLIEAAEGCRYV